MKLIIYLLVTLLVFSALATSALALGDHSVVSPASHSLLVRTPTPTSQFNNGTPTRTPGVTPTITPTHLPPYCPPNIVCDP